MTGPASGAGTDSNVYITLYGSAGATGERLLDNGDDNFERGSTDVFTLDTADLGELQRVRIRHDNTGVGSGWFLERIVVTHEATGKEWTLPCGRWLAEDEDDQRIERTLVPA